MPAPTPTAGPIRSGWISRRGLLPLQPRTTGPLIVDFNDQASIACPPDNEAALSNIKVNIRLSNLF